MFRSILLSIVVLFLLLLFLPILIIRPHRSTEFFERRNIQRYGLQVRVTAYKEVGGWLNGAYYAFEASPVDSTGLTEFMVLRLDDPDPIPKDNVIIVDHNNALAFMAGQFAVTTDGGKVWSISNAGGRINSVHLKSNGEGVMRLRPTSLRQAEPEMVTSDFGRHWQAKR